MSSGIGQFMDSQSDLAADRPQDGPAPTAPVVTETAKAAKEALAASAEEVVAKDPKTKAAFFVAVRQRGLVNAMLEQAETIIKAKYPGMGTRWDYAPPNGDDTMITAREAQGFRVVNNSEIGEGRRTGPVRRGDLIMMIGPQELVDELAAMDARAALEDLKAPEEAFRSSLESRKVVTKSGTEEHAVPFGEIKQSTEIRGGHVRRDGSIAVGPPQE